MSTSGVAAASSGGDGEKPAASAGAADEAAPSSPPKVPLIAVGTEEHGPFVPPKPEDIHAVKPALKKHPVHGEVVMADAGADGDDERERGDEDDQHGHHQAKKKKALKWDEHAIEEHDLLRGTRMKIDEPKTPYSHYDHEHHSDDDSAKHPRTPPEDVQLAHHGDRSSIDHGILERKLAGVAAVRDFYPSSPSASSSRDGGSVYSDEEEAKKKRQHDREFQMHRKHHYNEMEMLKRFRAEHPGGLLDGDEGDDDDDEEEDTKMEEG
mmetsp:Transcript_14321/g.31084  ORF Transcript_14321/g.31084 Transcript_14321/m.31084 type:complete len:266 (+) Transcript_14321:83-880(+)